MQEAMAKYRQMKDSGVSEKDPEFVKLHSMLTALQKQQIFHRQKAAAYAQQQQQNVQNAMANGNSDNRSSQPPNLSTTTQAPPTSASATPTNAPNPQNIAVSSTSRSSPFFTQDQLHVLRSQIFAFKCLSKNLGIPHHTQQQIFASLQKKQSASGEHILAGASLEGPQTETRGGEGKALDSDAQRPHTYETAQNPYHKMLLQTINYTEHAYRETRLQLPSIMPVGIDIEKVREERERIVYNRIKSRWSELSQTAANRGYWDTRKSDTPAIDDSMRIKTLLEMKMLQALPRQRALREKISRQLIQFDNLAMTANRSQYRRTKKQNLREARITEKLEKQQRDAREARETKKHTDYMNSVITHSRELINGGAATKQKLQKLGRLMQVQHQNIEKEEQKRVERTAKQRLQALKNNDEEAYIKLLDQAKDTRITHLLKQTDGFLRQLAASVKAQQRKAAERYGDNDEIFIEEDLTDDEDEEQDKKIDYYAVAHRIKEEVNVQPGMLVGGSLKEYQLKGLQWMISLYNNNLNGILADEMGLGKTIQTISLITHLIEKKKQNGPFLVIVPLSTLTNWNLEFEKWAPAVNKIVYKGPPNARKQQQQQIRYGNFQVLLTTFEYIIKDRPVLSKIKWVHMIIDEGHRMKNAQSKLSATLTQYYSTRYRLILTGTPLQNNLQELWAMLNFVLPTIFKSVKSFDEWFNTPFANTGGQDKMELTEEEQILVIRRLHKVLRPFLLRRLKKDVEKDLPDKSEKVIKCKFSALQARLYKQMFTHNKLVVSDGKGGKTGARGLSNMIMQLRKLCNHPFVFGEVENQMNPTNTSNDLLWRTAGKFELLDRILPKYQRTGHRVLMFFQMTAIMDIMEDFLRLRGIQFLRLDGTTKSDDRSDLLRDFNAPDSPFDVFLLSTRAGGLGLNLQTADTVIIYDSDWNPHQDLQAQDRAHRIGQKNEVRILRLISSNSVEEKILERAKYKLDMDGKVIQAGRFDNKSSESERDTMLRVMLETAEAADSLEQEEMDDDDLNLILARSDAEMEIFRLMDVERAKDPVYGTNAGANKMPRLMSEKELPEIYLSDGNPISDEPEEVKGRGARERTRVKYDDGLTEEQWLNAVDDDEDSPEAAAARKAAKKDRREKNRLKRAGELPGSIENSPADSRDSTEEPEPVVKKGRGRGKKRERKDEDDEEPPAKRPKPKGRPPKNAAANNANTLPPQQRALLQKSLRVVYDSLMELDSASDSGSDDSDEETAKRYIIGPFLKCPHKLEYRDYYQLIRNPIAMNMIEAKIKKEQYTSLGDLKSDIQLMCNNARTYNEDGSVLFLDANLIESACNSKIQDEFSDHPELAELEGGSRNGTSTAPTTNAGTPAAASAPRVKLTFKANNQEYGNGGSSGIPSDEED